MGAMDELINPVLVTELRGIFNAAGSPWAHRRPGWLALETSGAGLHDRPLRGRVDTMRDAIIDDVGRDFELLTDVVDRSLQQDRFRGWMIWPVTEAVAQLAVDASAPKAGRQAPGAFEAGLELMRRLTSRLSAEFALRIFLNADAARTIDVATAWCSDPDEHVRRLASEGTRSYLPWAKQVTELHLRPTLTVPIIDALYRDDSTYVRRSVGNHVNDLSRRHPELVVEIGKRWLAAPDRNTQALVKRAFRTLIKVGDVGALAAMGFGGDAGVTGPLLDRRSVRVGEDIEVRAILTNTGSAPTRLAVDYVVNYRKARGQTAPKVFKMATVNLEAGETTELTKRRSFAPTNTRVLHPGAHSIELQVNGRRHGVAEFELVGKRGRYSEADALGMRRSTMTGQESTDAVRALIEEIPTGRVVTYGDIADAVELGARQVGQILARRGHDLAWWRVVDANGHPPKDAQETAARHYEQEGIAFHRAGNRVIVNLNECRWQIQ